MRILHVITRLIVGGAQENTVDSVLGLKNRHGLDVSLISGPGSAVEGDLAGAFQGCPERLRILPSLVRPLHPWRDTRALWHLSRLFRRCQPDLVHTHSGKAGFLGRLAASRAGVPLIVHTIHGPSFGPFQGWLANAVYRAAEQRAGRLTTHFVSVAHAMTRQYLAAGIATPDRYTRILSGFDVNAFVQARNEPALRAQYGIEREDMVVGMIARLFKLKGHMDLFEAAPALVKACPRVKFLLVGDGPWRPRFEDMAARLGLSRHVVFTGLISREKMPFVVGVMDVLTHLSRREGLPRALPQALAAGRPVVAYDCDGAGEVCLDGETGYLVRPGDLARLTERLLRLATDADLRERLGRNGQARVRENFGVDKMVDDLHLLYQRLGTLS